MTLLDLLNVWRKCVSWQEMHVVQISASLLVYSLSYSILKNASTFGQIAVFTSCVLLSDIVTLFYHIIDNSPFEPTNDQDFFEKKCFWCENCAH